MDYLLPVFPLWWVGVGYAVGFQKTVSNSIAESQIRYLKLNQMNGKTRNSLPMIIRNIKPSSMGAMKEASILMFKKPGVSRENEVSTPTNSINIASPTMTPINAINLEDPVSSWNRKSKSQSRRLPHRVASAMSVAKTITPRSTPCLKRKLTLIHTEDQRTESSSPLLTDFDRRMSKFLPPNTYLRDVKGDGNCLFRAISHQLEGHENRKDYYRKQACEYMSQNIDDLLEAATGLIAEYSDNQGPIENDQEFSLKFMKNYS